MSKGSEGFKPRPGRGCPECYLLMKASRAAGENRRRPIGQVYQADSHSDGFEQVMLWGCDVCNASWETRKNRGLVEILLEDVSIVDWQQRRPYTFVDVSIAWEGKRYDGIGFSKVCVPDEWCPVKGRNIAVRHAVEGIVQDNELRLPVRPNKAKPQQVEHADATHDWELEQAQAATRRAG